MIARRIGSWPETVAAIEGRDKNDCHARKLAGFALGYRRRAGRYIIDGGALAAR